METKNSLIDLCNEEIEVMCKSFNMEKFIIQSIKNEESYLDYIYMFIHHGLINCVKYCIEEKQIDPNYYKEYKNYNATFLYNALVFNRIEIFEYLISKGADVNLKTKYDSSLLYCVINRSNLKMLKYIVEKHGVKIHNISIITAIDVNAYDCCKYLIKNGVNVNAYNGLAFNYACKKNNKKYIDLLLKNEAEIYESSNSSTYCSMLNSYLDNDNFVEKK